MLVRTDNVSLGASLTFLAGIRVSAFDTTIDTFYALAGTFLIGSLRTFGACEIQVHYEICFTIGTQTSFAASQAVFVATHTTCFVLIVPFIAMTKASLQILFLGAFAFGAAAVLNVTNYGTETRLAFRAIISLRLTICTVFSAIVAFLPPLTWARSLFTDTLAVSEDSCIFAF